jgi:hypothetical protein
MRYHYLVEEYKGLGHAELIQITWRDVIVALQPVNAFIIAETRHANRLVGEIGPSWQERVADGTWTFALTPEMLEEIQPGYLWTAAVDGTTWYEVRCLGSLEMNCTNGTIKFTPMEIDNEPEGPDPGTQQ